MCNCEAICPCRRIGGMEGGNSTYGICDFLLSWHILDGRADETELSGLNVALAGTYNDNDPEKLWHVVLFVDELGDSEQRKALEGIFLGKAGGTALLNFASAIVEIHSVKAARIELGHVKNQEFIRIGKQASAQTAKPFKSEIGVSCGIPGHDRLGQEIIADHFRVHDGPFEWNYERRCGFAGNFSYRNN